MCQVLSFTFEMSVLFLLNLRLLPPVSERERERMGEEEGEEIIRRDFGAKINFVAYCGGQRLTLFFPCYAACSL